MWSLILLSLALLSSTSVQHVFHVKPNATSPIDCPGQPCLTLDQYTQQNETYFIAGATFNFLAGNHTPNVTVNLINLSNMTFRRNDNDSDVNIICKNEVAFLCVNVTDLQIEELTFIFDSSSHVMQSSVVRILNSQHAMLLKLTFLGSGETNKGVQKAVFSRFSNVTIVNCLFIGNTGFNGGAVEAIKRSNLTLYGSKFMSNTATYSGGALYARDSSVTIVGRLRNNKTPAGEIGCASLEDGFIVDHMMTTHAGRAVFFNNTAMTGGAITLIKSAATLTGSVILFVDNSATGDGGALNTTESEVIMKAKCLYFIRNRGRHGGAILMWGKSLTLGETTDSTYHFANNSCSGNGGAISVVHGDFKLAGSGSFQQNTATLFGGSLSILVSDFATSGKLMFAHNHASYGGAIHSNAVLGGIAIDIMHNSADLAGGGISCLNSKFITGVASLVFISNFALFHGGGIWVHRTQEESVGSTLLHVSSAKFVDNWVSATCGGAVAVNSERGAVFQNITITESKASALCFFDSTVIFNGTTTISNSEGLQGGGIFSLNSILSFEGYTVFESNRAVFGGAINGYHSHVLFAGELFFTRNTAQHYGGAFMVTETNIRMKDAVHFTSNTARRGGVIYFSSASTLTLEPHMTLNTSHNHATEYGGVIFHEDTTTLYQCNFRTSDFARGSILNNNNYLPRCFLNLKVTFSIDSFNDSAALGGNLIYGGLLDRCDVGTFEPLLAYQQLRNKLSIESTKGNVTDWISSKPYQLCFCESDRAYNCSRVEHMNIYAGQEINISLLALAQGNTTVSTKVISIISSTARLKSNQSLQTIHPHCTKMAYNVYSSSNRELLVLYPEGPCHATGLAMAVINATVLPCPDAFTLEGDECVCEERLQVYDADCNIDDHVYITRNAGSQFWMDVLYDNRTRSYQGLILYKVCPVGYCTNNTVHITIDNLDIQCDRNHSGVLCGACGANYSLMLGSSDCRVCSSSYLALLLLFAAAGIVLVVFLTILRLTVATGTINSIILYANIVQVNKVLFFVNSRNVLTVFIAWMNLDLGFQTCFYSGMDAYEQTWLQFVFPVYVWILIGLIIFSSRYSITVSKLIGSNPIAVLATLLVMSYAKILRIIIEVYSSVKLDYPDNKTVTVWLKDANVPFLQSKHLVLTVVTSLVLIFLFLPYTFLLLLGHKLYRFTGRKYFRWLNRIKPLLDSYYAPYKIHTRYWTGLLLLIRCALYIVFSFGGTPWSLLAIIITFTAVVILAWLSVRIYKEFHVNLIEASIYLNLIVLSAATATNANTPALVYTTVGTVFVTMTGISVYQLYILYIAKSAVWLKAKARIRALSKTLKVLKVDEEGTVHASVDASAGTSSHDPHKIVSKTVIELREPLLECS